MNQKTAKFLRQLTGYQNSSATPAEKDFPGVQKNLLRVPVYETRTVRRKEWDPKSKSYKYKPVTRMVHGKGEKPRLMPPERKIVDGKLTIVPHEALVAKTNPVGVKPSCKRGAYRELKRATRRFGLAHVMRVLHNFEVEQREQGMPNA